MKAVQSAAHGDRDVIEYGEFRLVTRGATTGPNPDANRNRNFWNYWR